MTITTVQVRAIDRLAAVRAEMKALAKEEENIKELLKPLGVGIHKGRKFYINITNKERSGLDTKALRANLPAVYDAYCIKSPYVQIDVAPRI